MRVFSFEQVRPSFRDPRFALLVAGEAVNSIGGWASAIVLWGFAAYRFNASPYAVSVTIVCWAAPPALLSPLLGVYIDRIGPRAAVVAGYCVAACAALGVAASGSLAELAIAAVAYGTARALAGPAAGALPARIVADDDLLAANALLGSAASAGQVAGFWRELAEGITLVASGRPVRLVVTVSAAVTFTSAAYLVVEPLYARHVLHRPPSQFALFEAAAGIGAILAGLGISRIRARLTRGPVLMLSAVGYGLAACLFTGTTSVPIAYVGAFAWGAAGAVFGPVAVTTLQQAAPAHAHGRVVSVSATIQSWAETLALPLGGVTLAALGVRPGALTLAGVTVAVGLAWKPRPMRS